MLREGGSHSNRKECQVAARENSDAGMAVIATIILIPLAFLIVGSEVVRRAPRPMIHSASARETWQIGLVFIAVVVASLLLVFLADKFWKRK